PSDLPREEILTAKIELLGRTNMVDYAMDIHKSAAHSEEVPPAMARRESTGGRKALVKPFPRRSVPWWSGAARWSARLKTLEEAAAPLVAFLQNPATVQELRSDKAYNLLMLQEKYQVRPTEARTAPRWDNSTSRRCFSLRVPSSFSRRPPSPPGASPLPPSEASARPSLVARAPPPPLPSPFLSPLRRSARGRGGSLLVCQVPVRVRQLQRRAAVPSHPPAHLTRFSLPPRTSPQIGAEGVEALYWYAKFQFECGNYSGAADFLYQYRLLCSSPQRALSASWGKLAAELLMQNWDAAAGEELARVKEMIDSQTFASPVSGAAGAHVAAALGALRHAALGERPLQPRRPLSPGQVPECHSDERAAPAALSGGGRAHMQARRRSAVKEVARVGGGEACLQRPRSRNSSAALVVDLDFDEAQSRLKECEEVREECKAVRAAHCSQGGGGRREARLHDPSHPTQFLLALVVDLDFDEAQSRLKECEELLSNVFFLGKRMAEGGRVRPLRDEVIDSARLLMFENYCSIHRRIDIKVVAEKLSMATDAAERWMANLIRTAKLDATIDSEAGTLVMATALNPTCTSLGMGVGMYENLIERSRGLTSRTYALASNVAAIALQQ
ncbi:unnamed protein product, partial [Closterium sp. NIES-64]